jgi:hypothetical protein
MSILRDVLVGVVVPPGAASALLKQALQKSLLDVSFRKGGDMLYWNILGCI